MSILREDQLVAISNMKNGCILCGDVGSGKSRTSIGYYFIKNGGKVEPEFEPMDDLIHQKLIIITTAKKRDSGEWEEELAWFLLSVDKNSSLNEIEVVIDSWNNIAKYVNEKDAFFIFDEQRVVGKGTWVKSFIKISKNNEWILLSATPGDTWMDYVPVFIANGFYKNRTEFVNEHVIYASYTKFPKVDRYVGTRRLERLRDSILVDITTERKTVRHDIDIYTSYDQLFYRQLIKTRWNYDENVPMKNASELCTALKKVSNADPSRIEAVKSIVAERNKVIIFYNFDYELEILRNTNYGEGFEIAEWNGHKHQEIPLESEKWVYLVQYNAGCEGWNCIATDTIIFYSQNYSFKVMHQASGRIDRMNTAFVDLYYYHMKSNSPIEKAISMAVKTKKKFSESRFIGKNFDKLEFAEKTVPIIEEKRENAA